ncbi:hypothetical protein MCOR32_005482 [Pyricularia oryzae]|nr:hypothetical protein MCOR32_005482 [Pyricularia oryzae]
MRFASAWFALCLAQLAKSCLLPEESEHDAAPSLKRRQGGNTGLAIGEGDRFEGGKIVPRGLGTQPVGTDPGKLLSVVEICSAFDALANEYGFDTFEAPDKTFENRTIFGGAVGGSGKNCTATDGYRAFFNGAIHARERGSSDNVIYFIADLLYANKHNQGIAYGGRTWTNCDVKRALKAGIVFVPLSNPDGVAHDQATHSCWRKNRNPASATPGNAASYGIDLNRNFDFLWDFLKKFDPSVGPNVASSNPASQTFHGTAPFSEPETRAVKWVLDTFKKIRWYIDLHSYTGIVLHSWGSDENQNRRPYMNFMNDTYDSVRGLMPDKPEEGRVYGEYISSDDWRDAAYAGVRAGTAMTGATGRIYDVSASAYLYPTSGASDDYAFSRHFSDPSLNKVFSYTIEFGFGNTAASCPFYPTAEIYKLNLLETGAGFMEFLLAASDIGLGEEDTC